MLTLPVVSMPVIFGFLGGLGMQEMMIVAVLAVLLFGKNLPSVARSLGRSYADFKKGLSDIQSEFHSATKEVEDTVNDRGYSSKSVSSSNYDDYDDYAEATAPKFEPPPAEPQKLENG
ncbi:twin-arginine translocase TatA/TatE family subunit [Blastopirellula sp. JC732]|uniref:Twin-arginine translocase TatA/TatE family subunit n=1 Tax=Blastopirellula sediminis TaxID=2894196 RepID=A0A9X1SEP2_9BACT|nr:twin-arginine translocase TatA/TatE family subunit [Blastopirellula sediminis]MCC9607759.1 twin-arginine translocase TatA/TatE family subunit [Blastopirellula sediminis]MCC9627448.1 twin-arginine translocase TatA/TatE family subunit [Blastopirellula sediminis]